MKKTASAILTFGLIISIGIIFSGDREKGSRIAADVAGQNVEVRDGIQYVTIEAKGGYSPQISTAKAGIPTKLIFKTNGTYDCSSSLVIRSIGYRKVLSQTGEEVIDIGTPKEGIPLQGTCSMGMYSLSVAFI